MSKSKCNWCDERPVACVTRSTEVKLDPPYHGQKTMTRVVVIAACKSHKHRLVSPPKAAA